MTNVSNAKAQARTTTCAESNGDAWETSDIEFVIAFTDDARDEDIAIALGRTLYAVWSVQTRIRNDGIDATRTFYARRNVTRVERSYTFIGDDVPPGWND